MRTLIAVSILMLMCLDLPASADTYTVDPAGGGDFETLPMAMWCVNWPDTVELAPGSFEVSADVPGWPVELNSSSPCLVGRDGAGATILQGDGLTAAFLIPAGEFGARMHFHRITFRDLGELFSHADACCGGFLQFTDNVVDNCGGYYGLDARWSPSTASLISRCTVTNSSGDGIFTYAYGGTIEYCEVSYNGGNGISGLSGEEPVIRFNHIHHNAYRGVGASFIYTVEDNIIEDNGLTGISTPSSGSFRRNIIRRNWIGIAHGGSIGSIHENDIYDNIEFNVKFYVSYSGSFDLTMNWWGTVDPEEIAAGIWDCNDDPGVGVCALFDPWCMTPGCSAIPVEQSSWGRVKALYR